MSDRWNRIVNIAILGTLAVILLSPSGLVGRWITSAYQGWQEQRRIAGMWEELRSAPSLLGSQFAHDGVVIVEFVDYSCAHCQAVAPAVVEATQAAGVAVVVRHRPSRASGSAVTEAALAAICAEKYELFPEAHNLLLSDQTWLTTRDWIGFGGSLGIDDPESFKECLGDQATQRRLAEDIALADSLQIPGTPTFVTVEKLHIGAPGLAQALATTVRPAAEYQ